MSKNNTIVSIFVVGPIGESGSDIREAADTLKNEIIAPAVEEAFQAGGYTLERADEIGQPGRISLQVLEKLVAADIAIVDLAGLNPNVMYELGVRQACLKPYILMRPAHQALPFDIADIRAIDYEFTLKGGKDAIRLLRDMCKHAEKSVTTTDELLFGSVRGESTAYDAFNQRLQVQILDQLNSIREAQNAVVSGVSHLMQQEDRQRAEMAEYRQQELGMRLMETMAGTNPEAMFALIQQFATQDQGSAQLPQAAMPEPTQQLNRQQRRANSKKGRRQ